MEVTPFKQIFDLYFDSLSLQQHVGSGRGTAARKLDRTIGEGYVNHVITQSGIEIIDSNYQLADSRNVSFHFNAAMVELSFCLQGNGEIHASGTRHKLKANNCSLQFMHDFDVSFQYGIETPIRTLAICVPVSLFDRYMYDLESKSPISFTGILGSNAFRMFHMSIQPETLRILNQLIKSPFTATMHRMYAESKALELLAIFFDAALFERSAPSQTASLSKNDRLKLVKAQEVLHDRMAAPPSLIELSRIVGLNDYKLKIGFKEQYGKSVFAYLRDKRMDKAKELLQTGQVSVSQAAGLVGYANFSHFAELFRKYYGYNPSELIRERN
ncbi:helix-turn-helix transcriptional regulator [Paenibacillus sp. FSL H8-0034]|uniref:helix-turn-helix transcriptional regulator n=1 Tax=Paenibacillus sp. FSL H8-0034 TaxID=2954671 RepID=UPI0030FA64FC